MRTTESITRLYLAPSLCQRLKAMVCTGYPEETCGLLVGRQSSLRVQVWDLVQARNLNRERARDRYELDPRDFVATDAMARRQAMDIVGIWHSHPDHPARPSVTDQAAAWEGWSYVIASVSRKDIEDLRSWHLFEDGFTEEVIEYDW
ncbi:MAG: M67 family metallopeptidase [Pseudomonadota bacterium]